MKPQKSKKIPERKCMGCNEKKPKRDMIRVVRTPEGKIVLDETGKTSGRGVYICYNQECLKKVQKTKRLEKSLETQIPDEIYDIMEEKLKEAAIEK